jgi:hypothetical protein
MLESGKYGHISYISDSLNHLNWFKCPGLLNFICLRGTRFLPGDWIDFLRSRTNAFASFLEKKKPIDYLLEDVPFVLLTVEQAKLIDSLLRRRPF